MTGGRSWGQCWGGVLVTLLQGLVAISLTASYTYNWVYSHLHLIAKIMTLISWIYLFFLLLQTFNLKIGKSTRPTLTCSPTTFVAVFIVGNVVSLTLLSDEATSWVCIS